MMRLYREKWTSCFQITKAGENNVVLHPWNKVVNNVKNLTTCWNLTDCRRQGSWTAAQRRLRQSANKNIGLSALVQICFCQLGTTFCNFNRRTYYIGKAKHYTWLSHLLGTSVIRFFTWYKELSSFIFSTDFGLITFHIMFELIK